MQFEMNTMDQLKQEDIQREVDRNERLIIELAQLNLEKDQIDLVIQSVRNNVIHH